MTKPTKWLCAQRRLRSAWASSLSSWRDLGSLATHWAQWRLWSDWADAQADSLKWSHTHFVGFVMSRLIYESCILLLVLLFWVIGLWTCFYSTKNKLNKHFSFLLSIKGTPITLLISHFKLSLYIKSTVNFLNIWTPQKFVVITLKFELCGCTIE